MQHLNSRCPNKGSKGPQGPYVNKGPQRRPKNPQEPDIHDGKEIKMEPVEQLPDSELPGITSDFLNHFITFCI